MSDWIEGAIEAAVGRVHGIAAETSDFPHITEFGRWTETSDGVWTGGFWAGLLWLSQGVAGDRTLRERATHFTDRLLPCASGKHNHDLGFMFYPSAIAGWRETGNDDWRRAALTAARSLGRQFNEAADFIPGWGYFGGADWSGTVLIDTLMNLPLLVWAAREPGHEWLLDIVRRHARTALKHHMREDGSVFHVFHFDPADGRPKGGDTYQGLDKQSTWSRGQAWAITGLAMLADMTGERIYLEASKRAIQYFLSRLPPDGIPPWDFDASGAAEPKDASAGAIACYGLQRLYRITESAEFGDAATRLLQALVSDCGNRTSHGGVLLHATADLPHGFGIDESTMYGDYYYLKSLVAMRRADGRV